MQGRFSSSSTSITLCCINLKGSQSVPWSPAAAHCRSLAVLGHYCPAFFQKLATACPRHLRSFTGQSLACLAFAFALVGHGSDPLFQALELEVRACFYTSVTFCFFLASPLLLPRRMYPLRGCSRGKKAVRPEMPGWLPRGEHPSPLPRTLHGAVALPPLI